jgi:hypothetical protein
MNEPTLADVALSEEPDDDIGHVDREKKITDPTIAQLLRSARRIVEERAWGGGMVWYPGEMLHRASPTELANRVFPDVGTPAARACARSIGDYTGKPFTEEEARSWLANEIGKRLDRYVIGARNKIDEIRLVVTESKLEVRAERPETTRKAVGPAPWFIQI